MLHMSEPECNMAGNPTIIGDDVTVGHKVMLHGCTIENKCLNRYECYCFRWCGYR